MEEKKLTGYPSIDKPWLKYYSEEAINAAPPACTVYRNIYENNIAHSNDVALMFFGKKIRYAKLFREIDRAAAAFASFGIKENDNVAICLPAVPEVVYSILALNKLGANAALLNPMFTEEQLQERIGETEATLLITLNELYDRVKNIIPNTNIKTAVCFPAVNALGTAVKLIKRTKPVKGTLSWESFLRHGKKAEIIEAEYIPDRPSLIVYSSGTTGASKGIQLTNASINSTITDGALIGFDWERQDRWFSQIPIWFSTGICGSTLVPLTYGITIILEPLYDFKLFHEHMEKYRPNFIITPSVLIEYLRQKPIIEHYFNSFKYFCIGGDYLAPARETDNSKWMKQHGSRYDLFKGYGMCECGGTITASGYEINTTGSAGIPTVHAVVAAFDLQTGKELMYGERGELRISTPSRMKGYFKKPEETAKFFHTDENGIVWACTGDIGYVAEDGSVFVDGRICDSYVNGNGEMVYLFDIERAALEVPEIRQCKAVVSEMNGIVTHVCHIVFDSNAVEETVLKAIQARCRGKLPESYMPHYFRIHENALPIGPSGKLDILGMEKNTENIKEI